MVSKRIRMSMFSAVLAIPPVLLIAALVSKVTPVLEPLSSTVAADEQSIAGLQIEPRHSRSHVAMQGH